MASHDIEIRNLYKIFGPNGGAFIDQVKAGMSKSELNETHGHVLGLKDINIQMPGGGITVVMGLSGSGKSTLIRHINRLIEPTSGEVLYDGVTSDPVPCNMIVRVIVIYPVSATAPTACLPRFCREFAISVTANATLRQPVAAISPQVAHSRHVMADCALVRRHHSDYLHVETSAPKSATDLGSTHALHPAEPQ